LDIIAFSESFLTLFALIGLGALVARLDIVDEHGASQLSALVVNVTLPAAIFVSVATEMSPDLLAAAPLVVLLGVGLGVLTYSLGRLISRKLDLSAGRRGVYAMATSCTNTGFLGIALVNAVIGPAAVVTAVLSDFATTINLFTFGVAGLGRAGKRLNPRLLLRNLCNPMFLALVLAVGWSALGLHLPSTLERLMRLVGDATTPLAMIALGHMLYASRRGPTFPPIQTGLIGVIRLVLAPLLLLAVVWCLPMTPETKAVCVLQAGMPTAMLTPILAQQYGDGADHRFGLSAAMVTTTASLLTLPLLTFLVRWLFGLG